MQLKPMLFTHFPDMQAQSKGRDVIDEDIGAALDKVCETKTVTVKLFI